MVHKIVQLDKRYRIFIETLILTILILLVGFSLGFYVEYSRNSETASNYKSFEVDLLDLRLQSDYVKLLAEESCDEAIKANIAFADRIYAQGIVLERYEEANEILKGDILLEKKKYILLKNDLWLNGILLREKCSGAPEVIVYIYAQEANSIKEAEQSAISETLKLLKEEIGNEVILIPLAGDLGLMSVESQLESNNVSSIPSVIINNEIVLEGYHSEDEIKSYL